MGTILARIRSLPARALVLVAAAVAAVFAVLVAVLSSPDNLLGLLELALYIVGILGLSAAVTYGVIRVSPAKSKSKSAESS